MQATKRIAVVGAGHMGTVAATLYARHGYEVTLHDEQTTALESFRERAKPIAESLADGQTTAADFLKNVTAVADLDEALQGAFLVHENIQEDLALKQKLFNVLDRRCEADVVIATGTASFLLTDVCRAVTRRERVIGVHFVSPAHIIRAVELIVADFTPPTLVAWARRFLGTVDHIGIACRERPGFIINRMQFALLSEVHRIVDEGWASRDDVDAAVRLSLGPRLALWGPLLTEDLVVDKRNVLAVMESLHKATGDGNLAPCQTLIDLVAEGRHGAISGAGWYDFAADYPSVVVERDRQLKSILAWLRSIDPVTDLEVRTSERVDI